MDDYRAHAIADALAEEIGMAWRRMHRARHELARVVAGRAQRYERAFGVDRVKEYHLERAHAEQARLRALLKVRKTAREKGGR